MWFNICNICNTHTIYIYIVIWILLKYEGCIAIPIVLGFYLLNLKNMNKYTKLDL